MSNCGCISQLIASSSTLLRMLYESILAERFYPHYIKMCNISLMLHDFAKPDWASQQTSSFTTPCKNSPTCISVKTSLVYRSGSLPNHNVPSLVFEFSHLRRGLTAVSTDQLELQKSISYGWYSTTEILWRYLFMEFHYTEY